VPHRAIRGSAFAPAASRLLPHPSYPLRGHMRARYMTYPALYGVLPSYPNNKKPRSGYVATILPPAVPHHVIRVVTKLKLNTSNVNDYGLNSI
jgi:hypothetical protein